MATPFVWSVKNPYEAASLAVGTRRESQGDRRGRRESGWDASRLPIRWSRKWDLTLKVRRPTADQRERCGSEAATVAAEDPTLSWATVVGAGGCALQSGRREGRAIRNGLAGRAKGFLD